MARLLQSWLKFTKLMSVLGSCIAPLPDAISCALLLRQFHKGAPGALLCLVCSFQLPWLLAAKVIPILSSKNQWKLSRIQKRANSLRSCYARLSNLNVMAWLFLQQMSKCARARYVFKIATQVSSAVQISDKLQLQRFSWVPVSLCRNRGAPFAAAHSTKSTSLPTSNSARRHLMIMHKIAWLNSNFNPCEIGQVVCQPIVHINLPGNWLFNGAT